MNRRDCDILLGASSWEERNETLEAVLERAADFGIAFNRKKCMFRKSELEFYGYKFTNKGLKPTEKTVDAVKSCASPQLKTEVRSFLGMTGLIPLQIHTTICLLTKPLWDLTLKDVKFHWGEKEEIAFGLFKKQLRFNPKLPIMVRTEASYKEGLSDKRWTKIGQRMETCPLHKPHLNEDGEIV